MEGEDMIKREPTKDSKQVVTYVCDNCVKEMPGAAIIVYYPEGHINDSDSGPSHFCSDKCLVSFQKKLTTKYGEWKSSSVKEKMRASNEDLQSYTKTTPKARRGQVVHRKKKTQNPPTPKENPND